MQSAQHYQQATPTQIKQEIEGAEQEYREERDFIPATNSWSTGWLDCGPWKY